MGLVPDYRPWGRPTFYGNLEDFLARPSFTDGVHSICAGLPVDFYLRRGRGDTLVVTFGGAITNREATNPPYFSGLGITEGLRCSVLGFNDPVAYLSSTILIGWYVGTKTVPLQSITTAIIDCIARRLSCRVVFVGGSAGGFASLHAVTATSAEAIAIAINPQTNVLKYVEPFVGEFAATAFGCTTAELPARAAPSVLDLCRHYAGLPRKPSLLYLQNATDWHVQAHAAPFLRTYGLDCADEDAAAEGLIYHCARWGLGHAPIPKRMASQLLGAAVSWRGPLSDFVADSAIALSTLYPQPV